MNKNEAANDTRVKAILTGLGIHSLYPRNPTDAEATELVRLGVRSVDFDRETRKVRIGWAR